MSAAPEPLPTRIAAGLARLSIALRAGQWRLAEAHGLSATQAQILGLLAARAAEAAPLRPAAVAEQLGITRATASDALAALVRKGLVAKRPDPRDGRAVALALTATGAAMARAAGDAPALLAEAAAVLSPADQAALLRLVVKMIRGLQERGAIAPARICVTCRYFRPHLYDDPAAPHRCDFVGAPFGDAALRVDCAEHAPAAPAAAAAAWRRFDAGPAAPAAPAPAPSPPDAFPSARSDQP
ncbi:MarR family winged helix-turn-helix transcriptional regulator [Caldovatus aquaticus]|uniref:MarR family transcriptional regulator n=1 Tax=Caldovatus aquaticus TaxID=2865671 RepID=A0ABS7F2E9_9PROT|nr:MarR family transcriptional regulator [Caldovatus aquaticus]MBW8269693.1 MarR family transcriptional regulator [Caldovatus aquaticus]